MNPYNIHLISTLSPSEDPQTHALLSAIAPTYVSIVNNSAEALGHILADTNDFYCKTIILQGQVFSWDYLLARLKDSGLNASKRITPPGIAKYVRINGDTHLFHQMSLPSFLSALENYYCTIDGHALFATAKDVGAHLNAQGLTIATAESCTGGLMVKALTDVAGASSYVHGGACTYTAEVKSQMLGVSRETIDKYGVVSAPVAEAMAKGAQDVFRSDIALATTGVAGPGADSDGSPEGLVYIAIARNEKITAYKYSSEMYTSITDRDAVRKGATLFAFQKLLEIFEH